MGYFSPSHQQIPGSTCASKCSGVISTMGRNSMRAGSTPEMEWAEVAKNSYCRYFKVWRQLSRISPLYSSRMYNLTRERRDSAVLRDVFFVTNQLSDEWKWTMGQLSGKIRCMNQGSWSSITLPLIHPAFFACFCCQLKWAGTNLRKPLHAQGPFKNVLVNLVKCQFRRFQLRLGSQIPGCCLSSNPPRPEKKKGT